MATTLEHQKKDAPAFETRTMRATVFHGAAHLPGARFIRGARRYRIRECEERHRLQSLPDVNGVITAAIRARYAIPPATAAA